MALPNQLSMLSPVATLSASTPAQRAIAAAISSIGTPETSLALQQSRQLSKAFEAHPRILIFTTSSGDAVLAPVVKRGRAEACTGGDPRSAAGDRTPSYGRTSSRKPSGYGGGDPKPGSAPASRGWAPGWRGPAPPPSAA